MIVHPLEGVLQRHGLTWPDLTTKFLLSPATVRSVKRGFTESPHKLVQRLVKARIIEDEALFMREYSQWREAVLESVGA